MGWFNIFLVIFLIHFVPIVPIATQPCGEIIITDTTRQEEINAYDTECSEATLLHVKHTFNLHLKLSRLKSIQPLTRTDAVNISGYHRHLIEISRNTNLTWNNETLPVLELLRPLNGSLIRCDPVKFYGNFPFLFSQSINDKLLKAFNQTVNINVVRSRNTCKIINGTVYGEENCNIMSGHVHITSDFSMESTLAKRLPYVTELYGSISISGSTLENLTLFNNITSIKCSIECPDYLIKIVNNPLLVSSNYIFFSLRKMYTPNNAVFIANNILLKVPYKAEIHFAGFLDNPGDSEIVIKRSACKLKTNQPTYEDIDRCLYVEGDILINENTKWTNRLKNILYGVDAIIIRDNSKLKKMILQITKVYAQPGYNHISLISNILLCQSHADYFIDNLERIDGLPRIKIMGPTSCSGSGQEPKSFYFLLIYTITALFIPPSIWIYLEFIKKPKKKNSNDKA